MRVSLAIDSADTFGGGCTTHFSALLLKSLAGRVELLDYPLLVRLNPSIPWKTRGNAAVVLRFSYEGSLPSLVEEVYELAKSYGGDPGVAAISGEPWRPELAGLYKKALTEVVPKDLATGVLESLGGEWMGGRGAVGAIASLGALGPGEDHTYELLFYRRAENLGRERCVDSRRLLEAEGSTAAGTIFNYDPVTLEETASPGGPDPVLAGFRGDSPQHLFPLSSAICEDYEFWILFRSNQHTDAHALPLTGELKPYRAGTLELELVEDPEVIPGGHVIVRGEGVEAAFYAETGSLNEAARLLARGDKIRVLGTIRKRRRGVPVINAEKLWLIKVAEKGIELNPRCPKCGERGESLGKDKGFRCSSCNYRWSGEKVKVRLRRSLTGEFTPTRPPNLVRPPWRRPQNLHEMGRIGMEQVMGLR
ncbi:MAG: tRNA(Ile)(2)-agmatinylcytidine synthase [Acidilobaceae archaeon]|nr:tRNA(Ile)(2)-agmatinylcytidine synthase [Acidilobaceae archaeon]MDW7974482.1 tRNA(Ile)(2)-agmatinylcytidine synthase [Sulfolobales archaeon]